MVLLNIGLLIGLAALCMTSSFRSSLEVCVTLILLRFSALPRAVVAAAGATCLTHNSHGVPYICVCVCDHSHCDRLRRPLQKFLSSATACICARTHVLNDEALAQEPREDWQLRGQVFAGRHTVWTWWRKWSTYLQILVMASVMKNVMIEKTIISNQNLGTRVQSGLRMGHECQLTLFDRYASLIVDQPHVHGPNEDHELYRDVSVQSPRGKSAEDVQRALANINGEPGCSCNCHCSGTRANVKRSHLFSLNFKIIL